MLCENCEKELFFGGLVALPQDLENALWAQNTGLLWDCTQAFSAVPQKNRQTERWNRCKCEPALCWRDEHLLNPCHGEGVRNFRRIIAFNQNKPKMRGDYFHLTDKETGFWTCYRPSSHTARTGAELDVDMSHARYQGSRFFFFFFCFCFSLNAAPSLLVLTIRWAPVQPPAVLFMHLGVSCVLLAPLLCWSSEMCSFNTGFLRMEGNLPPLSERAWGVKVTTVARWP